MLGFIDRHASDPSEGDEPFLGDSLQEPLRFGMSVAEYQKYRARVISQFRLLATRMETIKMLDRCLELTPDAATLAEALRNVQPQSDE